MPDSHIFERDNYAEDGIYCVPPSKADLTDFAEHARKHRNRRVLFTPCGDILVVDRAGKQIPFTVKENSYGTDYELTNSKGERKDVNTKTKYDVLLDVADLTLDEEYKICLHGAKLHYGDSDEHTECVSGSANGYSIAIGAYDPNDEDKMDQAYAYSKATGYLAKRVLVCPPEYDESKFIRYDVEMLEDCSGFRFRLIDLSWPTVIFPVAWIKNEPGEEMYYEGAVEFWTT